MTASSTLAKPEMSWVSPSPPRSTPPSTKRASACSGC